MDDILLKEHGRIPKIKIELNNEGQPIGENYRRLSSCIGVQTRKMLPVGCSDWRLVDVELKKALWTDIKVLKFPSFASWWVSKVLPLPIGFFTNCFFLTLQKRFDIDDKAMDWVISSAGAKWKQYKAKLKQQIYDETLTDEEMKNLHGHRIDPHELDALLKIWRSPESQVRIN